MTIADIADEIRRELGDSSLSTPSISFWLRSHIGDLNNLLEKDYAISSDTYSITPELGEEEKSIFRILYNIYFYENKIRGFLGASSQDITLEVSSDGGTVRTVNKNEISKTYVQMKRLELETLDKMLKNYAARDVAFQQVAGDDTIGENGTTDINRFNRT